MNETVFIVGVKKIAQVMEFDQKTVRESFLGREDFPARKKGGRWIVTRSRLYQWADDYLEVMDQTAEQSQSSTEAH